MFRELDIWHRIERTIGGLIERRKEATPLADKDDKADTATKADVAKVQDDLNSFKGDHDRQIGELWKAVKKSGGGGGGEHEHVPAGHSAQSTERATGAIAAAADPPPKT